MSVDDDMMSEVIRCASVKMSKGSSLYILQCIMYLVIHLLCSHIPRQFTLLQGESNATINSYFSSSTQDATTLQNMGRSPTGQNGMLRDRDTTMGGDGKKQLRLRDTMRDEGKESEKGPRKRETASKPFTSSWPPSPRTS